MALKTTEERLAEIQTAITKVMTGGQMVIIDGETITRPNLAHLKIMEKELLVTYQQEQGLFATRTYAVNGGKS